MADNITLDPSTSISLQPAVQPAAQSVTQPAASAPQASQAQPGIQLDPSTSISFQAPAKQPGILDTIKNEVVGPGTLLGEAGRDISGIASDVSKGNIQHAIWGDAAPHVQAGSSLEKMIQKINPSFKGAGTPETTAALKQNLTSLTGAPLVNVADQIDKKQHPMMKAFAEASQSFLTPENAAIMVGTGGLGMLDSASKLGVANKLLSAGFTAQAVSQMYNRFPSIKKAWDTGDASEALYQATHMVLSGAMAVAAGAHAAGKPLEFASPTDKAVIGKAADVLGAAGEAIKGSAEERAAAKADEASNADLISAHQDFKKAIPSTKSAPYSDNDLTVADSYLEPHHQNVEPIRGVQDTVDALDHSIKGIENTISEHVKLIPDEKIRTDVLADVRRALSQNERGEEFVNAGMKEIEGLNLKDIGVERADNVRRQLNLENKKILKANDYDLAAARASDPGFAAREAAAESLRNGIYDTLEDHGIEGARDLRQEEGSLIKVRNAAQNQIFNAEKIVKGSSGASTARQIASKTLKGTGALVGAGLGSSIGGPVGAVGGAAVGGTLGEIAGEKVAPPDISRDALIERRFGKTAALTEPGQITVPKGIQAPPEATPPVGTQYQIPEPIPAAEAVSPKQAPLFGQQSPYPEHAALQSVQTQLATLQQAIRPLKAILDDPTATQAAKVEAAQKLSRLPLSELQNPTVEPAGKPVTPEEKAQASKIVLPSEIQDEPLDIPRKGKEESSQIRGHELGHAIVAYKEGFPVDEIRSHLHPANKRNPRINAVTVIDTSQLHVGRNGLIPDSILNDNAGKILSMAMAGAAADEIHFGVSREDNPFIYGDMRFAHNLLKELGFNKSEAEELIDAAYNRAKAHLTDPHAIDIINENRDVREPGLHPSLHVSGDRLKEIFTELDRRQNEANGRGSTEGGREHGKNDDAGTEGGATQQFASTTNPKVGLKERTTGDEEVDNAIRQSGAVPAGKMENLALFHDPKTGSTLALDMKDATPESVSKHLAESRSKYGLQLNSETEKPVYTLAKPGQKVPGLITPGNLNLNGRPIIKNDDGSISSEYSISFDEGGHEVLVPTVVDGKFLTPDGKKPKEGSPEEKQMFKNAVQHYRETGENLGIFDTPEHADAYATQVHNRKLVSPKIKKAGEERGK